MTVVHVLPSPDNLGGTERTAHLAAAGLRAVGHRVFLLHDHDGASPAAACHYDSALGSRDFFDGRAIVTRPRHRAALVAVRQWLDAIEADVVHVHGYPRPSGLRWLTTVRPTIATVHVPLCPNGARYLWGRRCACERRVGLGCVTGGYLRDGCGRLGNGVAMSPPMFARAILDYARLRSALERCRRLVVPSRWMAERLSADGFAPGQLAVVFPPIPSPPEPSAGQASPPAVLFVGRLVEVKGVGDLLAASAVLDVPHQVWIVGDGPDRVRLEAMVGDLGLTGRVVFFGGLPPDGVDAVRAQAALAALPSKWPETFAMVGPEALASALPVVAYAAGAVPEWLADGQTGAVVPSRDIDQLTAALRHFLIDPDDRHRAAQAARAAAARWSPVQHVRDISVIYDSVVRSPGQGLPSTLRPGSSAGATGDSP